MGYNQRRKVEETINVFGYIRVSGLGQVNKDGPERQAEEINSFCSKHNLTVLGTFEEEGVSGTVDAMDRPKFAEMISKAVCFSMPVSPDAPTLKIEAIVVERMDRLARDLMVSEFLLTECRKRDIKVFCADQGMLIDMASNTTDPTRVLLRQIMGAIAQWEKSVTVKKLRLARIRIRALSRTCEGRKPYGHHLEEKHALLDMQMLRDQGEEWKDIADTLNKKGSRTRQGKEWTEHTVYACITHRRTKGRLPVKRV